MTRGCVRAEWVRGNLEYKACFSGFDEGAERVESHVSGIKRACGGDSRMRAGLRRRRRGEHVRNARTGRSWRGTPAPQNARPAAFGRAERAGGGGHPSSRLPAGCRHIDHTAIWGGPPAPPSPVSQRRPISSAALESRATRGDCLVCERERACVRACVCPAYPFSLRKTAEHVHSVCVTGARLGRAAAACISSDHICTPAMAR